MAEPFDVPEIGPLLDLAAREVAHPTRRARAVAAAVRFPRSEAANDALRRAFSRVLAIQQSDDLRIALLESAEAFASPELLSTVQIARRDAAGRVRLEADRLLARSGDPDAVAELLDLALTTGSSDAARTLASCQWLPTIDLAPLRDRIAATDDPEASFWLAVVLARLGAPETLLDFVDGTREAPFPRGQPEYEYEILAYVRPLPDAVVVAMLKRIGIHDPTNPEQVRRGNLVVWALTGIADARGELPVNVQAPEEVVLPADPSGVADEVRALLQSDEDFPAMFEGVSISVHPHGLSNELVSRALDLPVLHDPSLAPDFCRRVGRTHALDVRQLATLAYRFTDVNVLIRQAARGLRTPAQAEFLETLGDHASGRGPNPFRGAGGGSVEALPGEAERLSALMDSERIRAIPKMAGSGADVEHFEMMMGGEDEPVEPEDLPRMAARSSAPAPAGRMTTVSRNPHMDLSTYEPAAPGARVSVEIYADTVASRPDETSQPVVIEAPDSVDVFEVEVTLVPSAHLLVRGTCEGTLVIRRGTERTDSLRFTVEVRSLAELRTVLAEGGARHAGILARFTYGNRPSGSVSRVVALELSDLPDGVGPTEKDVRPARPAKAISLDAFAEPADLVVTVSHVPGDDPDLFECSVRSHHTVLGLEPEKWHIGRGRPLVDQCMEDFISAAPKDRADELFGAGRDFFRAAPENFRSSFWHLVDTLGDQFQTITVVTSDPTVPWELMVPYRKPPRPGDPKDALGVGFDVGRWTSPDLASPPQRIPIRTGLVVAPEYEEDDLLWSGEEAQEVSQWFRTALIRPATKDDVQHALEHEGPGLFHFVGHGHVRGDYQELGLQGKERLNERVLRHWLINSGFLDRGATLVVLNACEVGRPHPALMGSGGISQVFVEEGAAAVIAPVWSVADKVARDVAHRLYEAIRASPETPIARILRGIRLLSYADGEVEDSYAAYCFYGDPKARVELVVD